ncbi:MAG: glycosyltransferase, partial [Candidatus Marinimicrobia bacterium]|nr:glycosyltransferase [Candidatus Neomarinimicrobiota bacterium]
MTSKPRLLVISKVLPFPGESGQQMRVRNTLESLRDNYHLSFLTTAQSIDLEYIKNELRTFVDDCIVLPSLYDGLFYKVLHKIKGFVWMLWTGLKLSNYIVGDVEITTERLKSVLEEKSFDIVLYEYWHAHKTIQYFKDRNIPTILDMHNILWQSYKKQLKRIKCLPQFVKDWSIKRYKDQEENIWNKFEGLIAINQKEFDYVKSISNNNKQVTLVPMGIDLKKWSIDRVPAEPQRVGYYGGLASIHNQTDAMKCYEDIMPKVWEKYPETEFWIIGSNPPKVICDLQQRDKRVHATGFIDEPWDILKTMSVMVLPWEGTYGFRSRIIE